MNWKILIKNIFGGLTFHTHFPTIDNVEVSDGNYSTK